ncbi:hypothetical protein GCM10009665_03040 [Kitasatospora nipponensis]|uniref:Thioredoxin domain-containing protein n=1 Tax=Kitasatospora nipponensis TaxID=258049 RepID=A0ABP4G7T4_9ACTN
MPGSYRLRPPAPLAASALALALVLGPALAGCEAAASGAGGGGGFVAGRSGLDTVPLDVRRPAPAVSGKDLQDRPLALADFRGQVVVVNVWSSWCSGCRAEAAGLEEVFRRHQGQGVQFVGINTAEPEAVNARRFEQTHGLTYPSLYDPDGSQVLRFPKGSLNPQSLPCTLVIDRQGRLAARALRALSADDVEALLAPVLAEQTFRAEPS